MLRQIGPRYLYFCGYSCISIGLPSKDDELSVMRSIGGNYHKIPMASDVQNEEDSEYLKKASKFTREFNATMLRLCNIDHHDNSERK